MDMPAFDALRHRLALTGGRRPLLGGLAALSLAGALLADDDAAAKRKRIRKQQKQAHKHASAEKKKKLTLCLNGQTVTAPKKKAKKLRKQGATNGACSATTTTSSTTAAPCIPDDWDFVNTSGTVGPGTGQLFTPQGCALSNDQKTLWVADAQNDRIAVWTRPSATSTVWTNAASFGENGSGADEFDNPVDLAVAPDAKTVWVADFNNHRISIWTRETASSNIWNHSANFGAFGSGPGQFAFSSGVSVAPDEKTVWASDLGNNRILVWTRPNFSTPFAPVKEFGATGDNALNQPTSVLTSQDTLTAWVVDAGNNQVGIWTRPSASSQVWTNVGKFGSAGSGPTQFNTPRRLATDDTELTLWVSDQENDRVAVWVRESASTHFWTALATIGSSGSGAGQFDGPNGVAVANDGATLLVTEGSNNRFSMWTVDC